MVSFIWDFLDHNSVPYSNFFSCVVHDLPIPATVSYIWEYIRKVLRKDEQQQEAEGNVKTRE
jgi:hypothetical protein